MEETEVEEGEAVSYHGQDEDSTIDPDIDLSYIGEKLESVLGHFQKDFEGGVSAENLGAKFGGYGSFLSTYKRSPSWSRTKSPPKVNNYDTPVSPRKLRAEDQRQNSLASSSASPTARLPGASGKTVSIENSVKGLPSRHVGESGFKCGAIKKSVNPSDQRTLKVRIKVGSDNLSIQKNSEIYSGLGLVVSPSSSLDDSQEATVEKLSGNRLDVAEKSPTSILKIMTSFSAVHLLSPLSEDLICLIEKRKIGGDNESKFIDKAHTENSGMLVNGSLPGRSDQKVVEQNKWKSSEKTLASIELTDLKNFAGQGNSASAIMKEKETDIDTLHSDEMVSNALKLPLISNSQYTITDAVKGMCTTATIPLNASKSGVKGEASSDISMKILDYESSLEIGMIEKLGERLGSSCKDSENKKGKCSSAAVFSHKTVLKEEKYDTSDQSDSNVSKTRNESRLGPSDLPKTVVGAHIQKDQRMVDSSLISISGKNSHANSLVSKNDSRDLHKDSEKSREMHLKNFFGDFGFEEEDDESTSREIRSSGRPKDPQLLKKRNLSEYINTSREKTNDKSSEKPNPLENYNRLPSHLAPPPTSEAQTGVAPIVKEDWVFCDKCKKWRLLPLGTNPKSLPEKWLCRMLTWLPGMNRCSIPEEETTSALRALYQPAADSVLAPCSMRQHNQLHNYISATVGVPLVDAGCPVRDHQNIADLNETTVMKKKHRADHSSSLFDIDGSIHSANSRKNLPPSSKNGTLKIGHHSPLDTRGFQSNRKESFVSCSKTGTNLKTINKLESDADDSRASKRMKPEAHLDNGKQSSENGGPSLNAGTTSVNGLSNKSSRHKDTRGNMKKDTCLNQEIKVPVDGLTHERKFDDNDSVRKRKGKDCDASQSYHQNSGDFVDGWDSDQLERKKARLSKSGGKGSSGSKSRAGSDEKGRSIDKLSNNQCLSNALVEDCLKNKGLAHPSVAANSSSSKVSGSHKNKNNAQEIKGSPVESVSSSPLRSYNADKVPSTREKLFEKDEFKDPYSSTVVSPRRISGGEDGGIIPKDMMKRDASRTVDNNVSNKKKSEKVSSHSKDETRTSVSEMDEDKIKEKTKSRKNKFDHRSGTPAKTDKFVCKNNTAGGTLSESTKVFDQSKFVGHDGQDVIKSSDKKHKLEEKLLKRSNLPDANGSGISHSLPPLWRVEAETVASDQPVNGSQKENGVKLLSSNQCKKAEKENGRNINLRHPTPDSQKAQDVEAPSPVRRESSSHGANNALKEAKDLKHLADRLKNSGSPESNGLYFQAALKFLHGASLLETGSTEGSKHNEMSMHIYSSTAKLCEFCAHEFEKSKDLAAAALAYKCVEVAYMRVVYYSHSNANKDRNELQTALQIVAPGESPFSSTSDVDNLNQATTYKGNVVAKVVGSPQVSGSHSITSQNRSGFIRLLNFAQDVNIAMEASRKSRNAFTAAVSKLGESDIRSLKMALDFNFQDLEGLLRLVRVSMEAVNR